MNFTDYAGLRAAISNWIMRPDLEDEIPGFIRLAEAELSRRLRTRQMVLRSRVIATERYTQLPSGWRKAWNVQRVVDEFPLDYLSPVEMDKKRYLLKNNFSSELVPTCTYYSLFGDAIEFLPAPSAEDSVEIEMLYFVKIPALTTGAPSNWLLAEHPDLYLYGALVHSASYVKEDERVPVWKEQFELALAAANMEDTDSKRSGAPMTRPMHSF